MKKRKKKDKVNYIDNRIAKKNTVMNVFLLELIPSVAKHEMQQLLSKYLLLLLPSTKSQINDNNRTSIVMNTSKSNNQSSTNIIQQLAIPLSLRK